MSLGIDLDIPKAFRDSPFVFLANGSPVVQRKVLHQVRKPKLVFADTMNLWIETQRSELRELLNQVDGLILNDQEAPCSQRQTHSSRLAGQFLAGSEIRRGQEGEARRDVL